MTFERLLRQAMEALRGTNIYEEPKKLRAALRERTAGDKALRAEAEDFAEGIKEISKWLPRIKGRVDLITLISEGREEEAIDAYPEIADTVGRKDYLGYIALMGMVARAEADNDVWTSKEEGSDEDEEVVTEDSEDDESVDDDPESKKTAKLPSITPRKTIADLFRGKPKTLVAMILYIAAIAGWILVSILALHSTSAGNRHAIGSVCVLVLAIWLWAMCGSLDGDHPERPCAVIGWVLLLINAVLCFTQGPIYHILGYWVCGYGLASTILCLLLGLDHHGKAWTLSTVAKLFATIALIIAFSRVGKGGWWQYQHIIGAFGGLLLLMFSWGAISSTGKGKAVICHVFYALIFLVANALLYAFLRDDYRIIAIWLSGYMILSCFWTLTVYEDKKSFVWEMLSIMEALLFAMCIGVFAVYGRGSWTTCQHLIGAFGGLVVALALLEVDFAAPDVRKGEKIMYAVWLLLVLGNAALSYFYRSTCVVISYWLSGYLLALTGLFAILNISYKRWKRFLFTLFCILIGVAGIVVPTLLA